MTRLLLIAVLGSSIALGQQPQGYTVSGQIREPNGNPAGNVRVFLTRQPQGTIYTGQTNDDGAFRFDRVSPGQYDLFAGALESTTLAGTVDSATAFVITTPRGGPPGPSNRGPGTYFPGTADVSQAAVITVGSGVVTDNLDFSLASGALSWGGPPLRSVRGKIVFEGGGGPSFTLSPFVLVFSDSPNNLTTEVTFRDWPQKPATASMRLEAISAGPHVATAIVPMPTFPDGAFRLSLPEGVYRVSPRALPSLGPLSHLGGYYVKRLSLASTDLMKDLMTVGASAPSELVITLAKCTDVTAVPLCR